MIGYEVNFYPQHDKEFCVDSEGPFFSAKELIKRLKLDIDNWLRSGNTVTINTNEYLGSKRDYDFNNVLGVEAIESLDDWSDICRKVKTRA